MKNAIGFVIFTLVLFISSAWSVEEKLVVGDLYPTNMAYNIHSSKISFDLGGTPGAYGNFYVWQAGRLVHSGSGQVGDYIEKYIAKPVVVQRLNGDCTLHFECGTTDSSGEEVRDGCIVVISGCSYGQG